jgi:hypothetical protein
VAVALGRRKVTMRRGASALSARLLHSSSQRSALPAITADEAPKKGGLLASLLGGSSGPVMPPMTEPLAGVPVPPYTPPSAPPATQQKKLANGAIISAEETPVRAQIRSPHDCLRAVRTPPALSLHHAA